MEKICFILNPVASGFKRFDFKTAIEEYLKDKNLDYEIMLTKNPKDAIVFSEDAINRGYRNLVAVGGDGTINEVASVVIKYDANLGIIPAGTGNDLINSLNRSSDFKTNMDIILSNRVEEFDYGLFDRGIFLNIASAGFDAEVVYESLRIKRYIKSGISYKLGILIALLNHRKKSYKLIVDGIEYEKNFFLIAVGVGSKYGGNMHMLPKADMKDGIFDICAVEFKGKFNILTKIPKLLKATHLGDEVVTYLKGKNVKIISDDMKINFDGEYLEGLNSLEFNSPENKINIIS